MALNESKVQEVEIQGYELWEMGSEDDLRWSTCVLVYFSWLLDHVIYLKLR